MQKIPSEVAIVHGNLIALSSNFSHLQGQQIAYKNPANNSVQMLTVVILNNTQSKLLMQIVDSYITEISNTESKEENTEHKAQSHHGWHLTEKHNIVPLPLTRQKADTKEREKISENSSSSSVTTKAKLKKLDQITVDAAREQQKEALRTSQLREKSLLKLPTKQPITTNNLTTTSQII